MIQDTVQATKDIMVEEFSKSMDDKLKVFKNEIAQGQKTIGGSQLTRIRNDFLAQDKYVFHKKGNEVQFKFNSQVEVKIREAKMDLEDGQVHAATEKMDQGMDLIKSRQKLIKIADSSSEGWNAVKEYEENPLASDSEDEKRINRAESKAAKKADKNRKIKLQRNQTRYRLYPGSSRQSSAQGQDRRGSNYS